MASYDLTNIELTDDIIVATKEVLKAEDKLAVVKANRASLADRCRANIQQYVDAMLPDTVKYPNSNIAIGSDREKWHAAGVVADALENELSAAGVKAFRTTRVNAITRRRIELDGELQNACPPGSL